MKERKNEKITRTAIFHTVLSALGLIITFYCLIALKSPLLVCMGIITTLFNARTVYKELKKNYL